MNKLINRISPETSENRILHAGFSIILMSEEITQTLSGLSSDMIIFILSGSITIYSTKEEKKMSYRITNIRTEYYLNLSLSG